MRPCTLQLASAGDGAKATSLDTAPGEHAPWCRTAPAAPLTHIKPLAPAKAVQLQSVRNVADGEDPDELPAVVEHEPAVDAALLDLG